MTRECHVRFCESAGVQSPRATHRNIYVCSQRAGERAMASVERFLERRSKLKINKAKSAVAPPSQRKLLGFRFTGGATPKRRIAPQALARFKERVRATSRRTRGASLEKIVEDLSRSLIGWRGCFGFCETPSALSALDQWIRRRLRSVVWKQGKRGRTRFAELRRRGVAYDLAARTAGSAHGPWRISNSPALAIALPNAYFRKTLVLASVADGRAA
jgi:RNA-directed DNA polymerase